MLMNDSFTLLIDLDGPLLLLIPTSDTGIDLWGMPAGAVMLHGCFASTKLIVIAAPQQHSI